MTDAKTFHIITLGCRTNQYESQSLREALLGQGYAETDDPAEASLVLINSCAVTAKAVRDTNQAARRAVKLSPGAKIAIAGCAAQVLGEKLGQTHPDAEIVPQSEKAALLRRFKTGGDEAASESKYPGFSVSGYQRSRAVVKVQDGCTHGCTFCIVPRTRGRSVSRDPADAVAEVRRLFEAGYAEVCLSGINLRHFGRDLSPRIDFWDLLRHTERELAADWAGRARIRLSSLDPGQLGSKAVDTLAESKLVCPHLHLSLQSLSPPVLKAMNRGHYGLETVTSFLDDLAGVWPLFGLGADLIAGFPGETEDDFKATLQACRELPLTYAHVFPYSKRPGTRAAAMPGQVKKDEAKARAAALRQVAAKKRLQFLDRMNTLDSVHVIIEKLNPASGICEYYVRCSLAPKPQEAARGKLFQARPAGVDKRGLIARPCDMPEPESR